MRILFIGDYSDIHSTIARQLRQQGLSVTLLSGEIADGKDNNISIPRRKGLTGGISYLYKLFNLLPQLKGYDIVQLISSKFFNLSPGKNKYFFERLQQQNGSLFLTLASNDHFYVKACHDAGLFRFSEFKVGNELTEFAKDDPNYFYPWISRKYGHWAEYLAEKIDGAISVRPELDMALRSQLGDKLTFANYPVEVENFPFLPLELEGPVRFFFNMNISTAVQKGSVPLLSMIKSLEREMPDKITVDVARNISPQEYQNKLRQAHVFIDRFYSYSPSKEALEAMALGKVAATGAQPEYFDYIGERDNNSIIPLSFPENDMSDRLRQIILNPQQLKEMSREGRRIVKKNNDVKIVAERFINHWEKLGK